MLEAFDFWMWRRLGKPAFRLQVTHSCSIVARMSACGLYYGLLLFAEHWGEIIHEFGDGWLPNRARLRSERWRRQGVQEALQRQGHQGWMGRTEGGRRGKYGSVHIMYMSFFDCIHVHTYIHVYMSPDSGSLGPPPWYGPPSSRSREHGTRDHTYIHACMHASMHPSIHPSIHTYIHTDTHTDRHTYIRIYLPTNIPTYLRTYVPTYLHTHVHTYIHTYIIPTYLPT
jgi:hypothetical protein